MLNTYPSAAPAASAPVWIDLLNPTPQESAAVTARFGVQVPSRASLQEIETSSRTRSEGPVLYVSMPLTLQDAAAGLAPLPLGFVLSAKLLLTVRFSEVHSFAKAVTYVNTDPHASGPAVFCSLIDSMVDFSADTLEKLGTDLAAVSSRIFVQRGTRSTYDRRFARLLRRSLVEVGTAGDHLSRIRESLLGLQRIVSFVAEMSADWLPAELKAHLKTARQDLASLVDFEAHLSGKTQFLLDAILGFISTEQNDVFKILTIVSVVGVPPTLIASMYGMNFHGMPELTWHYGYAYGLGAIGLSALLPILWFKRRGWW
jgi:magnesium transporter